MGVEQRGGNCRLMVMMVRVVMVCVMMVGVVGGGADMLVGRMSSGWGGLAQTAIASFASLKGCGLRD